MANYPQLDNASGVWNLREVYDAVMGGYWPNANAVSLFCGGQTTATTAVIDKNIFSTSGNSNNIHKAFKIAKELEMTTVLVGGKNGGICGEIADYKIIVPSQSTARIQEVHTFILHAWLETVESELFETEA